MQRPAERIVPWPPRPKIDRTESSAPAMTWRRDRARVALPPPVAGSTSRGSLEDRPVKTCATISRVRGRGPPRRGAGPACAGAARLARGGSAGYRRPRLTGDRRPVRLKEARTMPQTPHVERHFSASETIRDIVIGMSDGLTVPFALAAGLSGAAQSSGVVITAGLAEIAAGSIAMGLGGYLAARTDAEHYDAERAREARDTIAMPEQETAEVARIFRSYGLPEATVASVAQAIRSNRRRWVDFMMKFELGLEKPDPRRARTSALTIALSYVAGGLVPLAPYMVVARAGPALAW